MNRPIVYTIAACLLCAGCSEPAKRLNAPPHGVSAQTSELQGTFTYMADNALLADMTVSDVHFLPHRAVLSTLGKQRLTRLASLLDAYGGTIRYSTSLTDEELVAQRTDVIMAYLAETGVDTTREFLTHDLPGGRGLEASEVILIKANEGTYKPKKKRDSSQSGGIGDAGTGAGS